MVCDVNPKKKNEKKSDNTISTENFQDAAGCVMDRWRTYEEWKHLKELSEEMASIFVNISCRVRIAGALSR
jgi:hypothetical protein